MDSRDPLLRGLCAAAVAAYVFDLIYMRPRGYANIGQWIDRKATEIRPDTVDVRGVIERATAITREASNGGTS